MKKFFKEHTGSVIVVVVALTIIALSKTYGASGGPMDKTMQSLMQQSAAQVTITTDDSDTD